MDNNQLPMRYLWAHFTEIEASYRGEQPLARYLKTFFKAHPKLGGRDRRMLSDMLYCWYRAAKAFAGPLPTEVKVYHCLNACGKSETVERLFRGASYPTQLPDVQLLAHDGLQLSSGIMRVEWLHSMWQQPLFFIRTRKKVEDVEVLLQSHHIPYTRVGTHTLALPNGSDAEKILPERDYVVQDLSSQAVGNFLRVQPKSMWLDCCSGAGGKALLLVDKEPTVRLTVSDIRPSILSNLRERFHKYQLPLPEMLVMDASNQQEVNKTLRGRMFDNIICDVPCSGSGTWSRTPEQLYFFDPAVIPRFATLQLSVALNVARFLKPGGTLYYITCSVFAAENEAVVQALAEKSGLILLQQ
ncbi:MAG: RsmB/NOP family class I SAM-dependent RNA methyltransferase, partial [Chitinophagia bacterium]|nr:RsmB/NOP family class I SAM-dependent RNA methyltransferase [Chitinophagia bacterium]